MQRIKCKIVKTLRDVVIWSFSRLGLILSGRVGLEFSDSSPGKRIEH